MPAMNSWAAIRNAFLTCFTIAVIAGLMVADWYLRHAPARQAERILDRQAVAVSIESAVQASGEGRIFVLELLELTGIDLGNPDSDGRTPLMGAIRSEKPAAIDFLLDRKTVLDQLDVPADPGGYSALEAALQEGDFGLAGRLVELGARPVAELEEGFPLLVQACRTQDRTTVEFLLSSGADPNAADTHGVTAIAVAIENQDGENIRRLLDAGADVEATGVSGESLLMEAVGRGDDDLADLLLQAGADPDRIGVSGAAPLLAAIRGGDIVTAEVLLDRGADPDAGNTGESRPLYVATGVQDIAAMDLLIRYGAGTGDGDLVLRTIRDRNVPGLRLLLNSGAVTDVTDPGGQQVLDVAVADGAMETARALFEAGASARGKFWPALLSGHDEMLEMVLLFGASVDERDPSGVNPLDFALRNGRDRAVGLMLEGGANPNLMRDEKESWLAAAIRTGDIPLARALLDRGACIDQVSCKDGHSLLGWAIARKETELAKKLIDLGADVRARERAPASDEFKAQFERSKTFRWHLQVDSRINPLMLAAAQGDREIAKALVDAGAQKGEYSRRYLWPINIAAWHMDVPMMQIILGRDPDPDNQPRKLVIDLSQQKVTLLQNGRSVYSSRISTGKSGYRTKTGTYIISDKHRHHNSTLYGSSMPYFMRLSCDAFGLHQGYVPNYPASHGCIRVPHSGAKHLFYACEVGDVVVIQK